MLGTMSAKKVALVQTAIGSETGAGPLAVALMALAEDTPATPTPGVPAGNGVIYRPGGMTAAPVYATWAEVQAIILDTKGDVTVFIDSSITSPAPITGATDGFGRLVISPAAYNFATVHNAEIVSGASLDNVQAINGLLSLISNRIGGPAALQHSAVNALSMSNGAQLIVGAAATLPFIEVAGSPFAMGMSKGAGVDTLAGAVPVVVLAAGAQLLWSTSDGFDAKSSKVLVTGVAGAQWTYEHDLGSGAVNTTGMAPNTATRELKDWSSDYTYKPDAPATSLGATQFSEWADIVYNMNASVAGPRRIGPRTLWIDSTFAPGGIADVPPGPVNFVGPITWRGVINTGVKLRFAAGVRLTGLDSTTFEDLTIILQNTVDPVIEISGAGNQRIVRLNNTFIDNTLGTQPFVEVSDFATGIVVMRGDGAIGGGPAGTEALKVIGESALYVQAYDLVAIGANALDYSDPAPPYGIVYLDGAASLDYTQANCPSFAPDLPGSIPELLVEGTYRLSFTNANLAANVLTVLHRLSEKFVLVDIFEAGGRVVNPAVSPFVPAVTAPVVTMVDENTCTLDFGAPLGGGDIYHVVVRR
jgi:hypothetical protein